MRPLALALLFAHLAAVAAGVEARAQTRPPRGSMMPPGGSMPPGMGGPGGPGAETEVSVDLTHGAAPPGLAPGTPVAVDIALDRLLVLGT